MNVRSYKVEKVERKIISTFVETNHYSGSINGVISDYCFALYDNGNMIGAAIFGRMAMANQWKRFSDSPTKVIELRRLCCIDAAPRNSESYFIGKMLKWLSKNTDLEIVVSYADAQYNHVGTIYKASNFEYLGKSKGAKVISWNGKLYHDKCIRTRYNGKLKPFAQRVKNALESGEANYMETKGKHTFLYRLRK